MASLLAILQDRLKALKAEGDALVVAAETAPNPEATLEALAASADRRAAISAERDQVEAEIATETTRRDRARSAPAEADAADAGGVDAELTILSPAAAAAAPAPFADFGSFLSAVKQSAIKASKGIAADPRLVTIQEYGTRMFGAASGMNEGVGNEGGFLVQHDIANDLLTKIETASVLWPRTTPIPIGAGFNGVKINLVDETSRVTGSRFGGVQVYWVAEAGAGTAKKPKLRQLELQLQRLIGLGYETGDLTADTTASSALLERAFTAEIAFTLDDAIMRGTGAGMPKGIIGDPATVVVTKETGQAVDTVLAENIDNMWARFWSRGLTNARWYINQALWPQIFALHRVIGTGGVPMFIPSGGIGDAPGGTLLGRPIEPIEQASAPGDVGDITLADMSQWIRIEKGGIARASSLHVEFLTDQEVFRWVLRVNGAPGWASAVTPFKGSATIAPFVVLEAR